jgi:hypothetical protein
MVLSSEKTTSGGENLPDFKQGTFYLRNLVFLTKSAGSEHDWHHYLLEKTRLYTEDRLNSENMPNDRWCRRNYVENFL